MTTIQKPKRALLAYCALADRLQKQNAGLMEALMPFFAPVCRDLAGKMFDASEFSDEVAQRYGLRIPRLAILGLAEQLEQDGLLESILGSAQKSVYKYAAAQQFPDEEVPAVTEAEVGRVLEDFVKTCRDDDLLSGLADEALHEGFLDRLLHTDSMRLLSRKEAGATTKRTGGTLTLKDLSAFLWARRFRNKSHTSEREPLAKQNSKLIHGGFPVKGCPHGFVQYVP